MEQEKSNDVLVVKSDKEWMRYIYRDKTVALLMSMVLLSGTWVGIFLYGVSNGTVKKTSNIILFIFAFMIIAEIIEEPVQDITKDEEAKSTSLSKEERDALIQFYKEQYKQKKRLEQKARMDESDRLRRIKSQNYKLKKEDDKENRDQYNELTK